jgi:cell division protein FtsB
MPTILKRLAFIALVVGAGTYAVMHLRGPNGIPALLEKRKQIRMLEDENLRLRDLNEKQRKRNKDLSSNEDVLRQEIQKRYGKVPEGAVEFRTNTPDASVENSK